MTFKASAFAYNETTEQFIGRFPGKTENSMIYITAKRQLWAKMRATRQTEMSKKWKIVDYS